eukprot:8357948-Alexandrium_andersonii.AAC.1
MCIRDSPPPRQPGRKPASRHRCAPGAAPPGHRQRNASARAKHRWPRAMRWPRRRARASSARCRA